MPHLEGQTEANPYVLLSFQGRAKEHQDFTKILDCLREHSIDYEFRFNNDLAQRLDHDGVLIVYLETAGDWIFGQVDRLRALTRQRRQLPR